MAAILKSSLLTGLPASSPEDVSQGVRRATEDTSSGAATPDPEVAATAKRRQFSMAEKRRILAEADRCTKPGELGALMRREGIYSSHLSAWRKHRANAERSALAPQKRGPKPDAHARQVKHLNRDIARLRHKLERAEIIIHAQKKLCVALGLPTSDDRTEDE